MTFINIFYQPFHGHSEFCVIMTLWIVCCDNSCSVTMTVTALISAACISDIVAVPATPHPPITTPST